MTRRGRQRRTMRRLRARLQESEELLAALRRGEVDALVLPGPAGEQVYRLEGAEQSYRLLVEDMAEGAVTLATDGTVLFANRRFADLVGAPLEKVRGRLIDTWFLREEDRLAIHDLIRGTSRMCSELFLGLEAPVPVKVAVNSSLVDHESGTCCLMVTDLSQEKHNEVVLAAERLARSILEQVSEAVLVCDERGYVTRISFAVHRLGLDPLGKSFVEAVPLQTASGQPFRLPAPDSEAAVQRVEVELRRGDVTRALLLSLGPLAGPQGQWLGWVVVLTDLTQRKAAERARLDYEAAAQASALKSQFLAIMSHEIRTPLNAVIGLTYLTLQTDLTERQRGYLRQIQVSGRDLLRLVDDILDFSKAEAGKLDLEQLEFELHEVVGKAISTLSLAARQKGLELLVSVPAELPRRMVGDPRRLGQILLNLVGNAIKFTPAGRVELSVRAAPQSAEDRVTVRFEVRDTGIGMSAEHIGRLFTAFSQADSSISRKFGGTGLGLALTRQLVEQMGGVIAVVSQPGQGSLFVVTLSFRAAASPGTPAAEPEREHAPPNHWKGRVLVVEDNPTNQLIARELLERVGLQVDVASNGREAVDFLSGESEGPWQVVLMDLQMPEMDGYRATSAIRAQARYQKLPIVAMTAHVLAEERQRCRAAGMDDFLAKPVDPNELYAILRRWLPLENVRAEPTPEFPKISGVDTAGGLGRVGGNAALYRSLLLKMARWQEPASALEQALAENDAGRLAHQAHSLKGEAGNLGLTQVWKHAAELEKRARQVPFAPCPTEVTALVQSLREVNETIRTALEFPAAATPPLEPDWGAARESVRKLAGHLEAGEGEALEALEEVLARVQLLAPDLALGRLADSVRAFDYAGAAKELQSLEASPCWSAEPA